MAETWLMRSIWALRLAGMGDPARVRAECREPRVARKRAAGNYPATGSLA